MYRFLMTALALLLGTSTASAVARELEVEFTVLHIGGLLSPKELESMLADERLSIEAVYEPTRLVEGVTARRERTLPLGSKLFPITQTANLAGAQVERQGRSLRFKVSDAHPTQADYRLLSLTLSVPIARGTGRPQPNLSVSVLNPVPRSGAQETAFLGRYGMFDLGVRVRHRWSDAKGAAAAGAAVCGADVQSLGDGEYYFFRQHRMGGLFRSLASDVQSDPPSRPVEGRRSLRLRAPFPAPLTGFDLSRNHLIQMQVDGSLVERYSLYGTQTSGQCRRSRAYEALFADGKLVEMQLSVNESGCTGEDSSHSRSVEAAWLDDGSLARYNVSTNEGSRTWTRQPDAVAARCGTQEAPPPGEEVQALVTELQRIRGGFKP